MKNLLTVDYYNSLVNTDSKMFSNQEEKMLNLGNQLLGVEALLLIYIAVLVIMLAALRIGYSSFKATENGISPKVRILLVVACVVAGFSIVGIVQCVLDIGASVG